MQAHDYTTLDAAVELLSRHAVPEPTAMTTPPNGHIELERKLPVPEVAPTRSEERLTQDDGTDRAVPRWRFWIVFASLCAVMFLTALDSTVITIALPTISRSLRSNQYTWIVNAYTLACSVFLLVVGQLADVFDRKPIVLACVFLLGAGSAVCGWAQTIGMMVAGRVVQGVGGGGIAVLAEVLCSDMVAIGERSKYLGLLLALAALGTVVGPSIGGGIVAHTSWRWIFYINLPLSGLAFALLLLVLPPQTPGLAAARLPLAQKLRRIDWLGNALFAASATALLYGLITGGHDHPWRSAAVIAPLVCGAGGLAVFGWYEGSAGAAHPVAPPRLFNNRTAAALHLLACFVLLALTWSAYFLPVYFQAVLRASPERSSVLLLPTVLAPTPFSVAGGMLVAAFPRRARDVHQAAAALLSVAFAVFTLFDAATPLPARIVAQAAAGAGVGLLVASILPALQAQLPARDVAAVTALFNFMRGLGAVWGVALPSVVFDARVAAALRAGAVHDAALRERLAGGGAFALAGADFVGALPDATRAEVVALYVASLRVTWYVAMAFSLAAFLLACAEKRVEIKK